MLGPISAPAPISASCTTTFGPTVTFSPIRVAPVSPTLGLALTQGQAFPVDAFFRDPYATFADPRKGLWHPVVALVCALAQADPFVVWRALPTLHQRKPELWNHRAVSPAAPCAGMAMAAGGPARPR